MDYEKQFKILESWEFDDGEEIISEHKQVRRALFNFDQTSVGHELSKLASLRKKADYEPFIDITSVEVQNAITYMEKIFNNLKFQ